MKLIKYLIFLSVLGGIFLIVYRNSDRGAYGTSALGICGIAMKSGAYWVGFVCAAAVIVGVRMAAISANAAL